MRLLPSTACGGLGFPKSKWQSKAAAWCWEWCEGKDPWQLWAVLMKVTLVISPRWARGTERLQEIPLTAVCERAHQWWAVEGKLVSAWKNGSCKEANKSQQRVQVRVFPQVKEVAGQPSLLETTHLSCHSSSWKPISGWKVYISLITNWF